MCGVQAMCGIQVMCGEQAMAAAPSQALLLLALPSAHHTPVLLLETKQNVQGAGVKRAFSLLKLPAHL